jgi:predicted nucleic acid-binding protein
VRVYLDSSAMIKRAVTEPESVELREAVARHTAKDDVLLSSALGTVEVSRVLRSRLEAEPPHYINDLVDRALGGVAECALSSQVIGIARRLGPTSLRSLDAIHLATASIVAADLVIAYDERLLRAARELGFRTASPGAA